CHAQPHQTAAETTQPASIAHSSPTSTLASMAGSPCAKAG
ncbi:MAG: hypothetical protein AVDCRST_MAG49-4095, partial [uncultured Thermomicrobiales bacterium]